MMGWGMLGDISYIKLLYNPRANIVFTIHLTTHGSITKNYDYHNY